MKICIKTVVGKALIPLLIFSAVFLSSGTVVFASGNYVTYYDSSLKIITQPTNMTVEFGDNVNLSLQAQGEGLQYQWYFKKAGQTSFSVWKNRTHASETVMPNATWNGIQLYCVVRDSAGNKATSDTVKITFANTLKITTQPTGAEIALGDSLTLSLSAEGVGLSYQWYYKKVGQTSWNLWKGRTHASETAPANETWNGIQFFCRVSDSGGNTVDSNIVRITVTQQLKIITQPMNKTVRVGDNVTLSLKAQGVGLSYQWYYKKVGQTSWNLWKGRTHVSETALANETWNGIQLYCVVKDSGGGTVDSNTVRITVNSGSDGFFKPWQGLRVSVLGDSISTFPDAIPSKNKCYYGTDGHASIASVDSMWWKQLCDITGATPHVIEAWSGSCCAGYDSTAKTGNRGATAGIEDSRCRNLHTVNESTTVDPDVIIIALGCNDYYYNVPLGSWDGHNALSPSDTKTWRGAYANMLVKIHEQYPDALVFCFSPWFCVRGHSGSSPANIPAATVNINGAGYTYQDYENAMKDICELLGAIFIDANNLGFTRRNYPSFAVDYNSSTGAVTHPNTVGQEIMGQSLAAAMKGKAVGYINWLKNRHA